MTLFTADMELARRSLLRMASAGHEWSDVIRRIAGGELVVDNLAMVVLCRLQASEVLRPLELQESLAITSGGTTKLIDRLEEAGLVARLAVKPDGDGRGVQIALTRKGSSLLREVLAAIAPKVDELNADLAQIAAEVEAEYSQPGSSDLREA